MAAKEISRPEAALQDQSGRAIKQNDCSAGHVDTQLAIVGWRYEAGGVPPIAKLLHFDGGVTYIQAGALVNAPEFMALLSDEDQFKVREVALHGGVR